MQYRLDLILRNAEGALARVLDLIERKGFRAVMVDGDTRSHSERWQMAMTIEGERDHDNLRAQLQKLHDCIEIEVTPCR